MDTHVFSTLFWDPETSMQTQNICHSGPISLIDVSKLAWPRLKPVTVPNTFISYSEGWVQACSANPFVIFINSHGKGPPLNINRDYADPTWLLMSRSWFPECTKLGYRLIAPSLPKCKTLLLSFYCIQQPFSRNSLAFLKDQGQTWNKLSCFPAFLHIWLYEVAMS